MGATKKPVDGLTKKEIGALKYPHGPDSKRRYVVQDKGHRDSVRGLGVRVYPNGRKVFILRYWHAGRQRLMTLGEYGPLTLTKARKKAESERGKLTDKIDPLAQREARVEAAKREREKRKTLTDLAAEYMDELDAKPSTTRNYRQLLDSHILPRFGKREAASITADDVRRFKRAKRRTPYACNRALFLLGALLDKGGVSHKDNPLRGGKRAAVKRFKEPPRRRYLTAGEIAGLGASLTQLEQGGVYIESEDRECGVSPHAAAAIRVLALTGCRVNEALQLRHEDVDRERGVATIREHKTSASTDEPKVIPLTPPVLAILDGLPRTLGHPYVFEGIKRNQHLTDLRRPWQRAVEVAGLQDVRLHDLRHTVASVGASGGLAGEEDRGDPMTLHLVGGVLGHKSMQSTARYAHLQHDAMTEAAAQIAERIAAAMTADPAEVVRLKDRRRG